MRLALLQDSSRQSTNGRGAVPVIELFTDEVYVLAREFRAANLDQLRVIVLSAKFGFVGPDTVVRPYANTLNYERVDRVHLTLQKQWDRLAPGAFEGVDDLFVGLTGPHLYAAQRVGLAIYWKPKMRRVVDAVPPIAIQLGRWLETEVERGNDLV